MIKPTIGRVVHFWAHKATDIPQPLAAIITWVHSDTEVNLAVFQANGVASNAIGIPLWQQEGTHPQLPYCEWMDYQIHQAAKEGSAPVLVEQPGTKEAKAAKDAQAVKA